MGKMPTFWRLAIVVALICAAFAWRDFRSYQARDARARDMVSRLGARATAIESWPQRKNYVVWFDTIPTDRQLAELAALNSFGNRFSFVVHFPDEKLSRAREDAIRSNLWDCVVYFDRAQTR